MNKFSYCMCLCLKLVPIVKGDTVDTIFAEIEFEHRSIPVDAAKKRIPAILAQTINQRAADPIREKFYAMRRLASDNPLTWRDARLFYKQAKFMEAFCDDYPGNIMFTVYHPCYQHMGYEQLRTYFTWRTKVRLGEYPPTSLSYVFVYIYELLQGIGVPNPAVGLEKLIAIWNVYREQNPALDKYLPEWLKDYHIYYALPGFAAFINKHGLQRHYPELLLFEADAKYSLDLWSGISSYKIAKSKFYSGDNVLLLKECFCAVLRGIQSFCIGRNIRIDDLFIYETNKGMPWYPFRQALFYNWLSQPNRRVEMLSETYHVQGNQWTASISMHHSGRAALAGYIIKKTEVCLRQAIKYKYKITADHGEINRTYQKFNALGITLEELDQAIKDAVALFNRERTRTVVTVSRDNLARIRDEALGTQEKLIVPEDSEADLTTIITDPLPESHVASDGWSDLCNALDATERRALTMLLHEDMYTQAKLKALADEKGLMLEVLADGINEKAADHIGDNILEMAETMTIYKEYKEKIAEMMG